MTARRTLIPAIALFIVVLPARASLTGKIVFTSDRIGGVHQLFVTSYGSSALPQQLTSEFYGARHPRWSPNGKYVAYISSTVISTKVDVLNIVDENGLLLISVPASKFNADALGYPQWADDGQRIVLTFFLANGQRGIGLVTFLAPYQFAIAPQTSMLIQPGGAINPGEAAFSRDGTRIYFSGDASGGPALLWVTLANGIGTPSDVKINNVQIRRFFAPSVSPDGDRILYNSELWKDQVQGFVDEEIVELNLAMMTIQQITHLPGNQYAWFARNGSGERVEQSNTSPGAKYDLFLRDTNGTPVPLDVGDPAHLWINGSPDWWKPPCEGGTPLWANGEVVGCKFATSVANQKSLCGAWTQLVAKNDGKCNVCVDLKYAPGVLAGNWAGLTEGASATTATPADFACRACVNAPTPPPVAAWWGFDEATGPTAFDLSGQKAHGTHVGGPVPVAGRVSRALRFNGTTAYVQAPNTASLSPSLGDLTIDAWVRLDVGTNMSGIRTLVEKRQANPYKGFSFFLFNGALALQLADGLGTEFSNFLSGVIVPADGKWHFVAVTLKRSSAAKVGRFYFDGAPAGSPFDPTPRSGSITTTTPLRIGSSTIAVDSLFKGSLDEVEVFRRELKPPDIQRLYNAKECGKCK